MSGSSRTTGAAERAVLQSSTQTLPSGQQIVCDVGRDVRITFQPALGSLPSLAARGTRCLP